MPERIYTGSISCPGQFLRSMKELKQQKGKLSILIPPITMREEAAMEELLSLAESRSEMELSLNDWGTLYRCAERKRKGKLQARLTAGVLLAGQDTDPILESFLHPAEDVQWQLPEGECHAVWWAPGTELLQHWRMPSVFGMMPLLQELQVSRIELCAQPFPLPEESPGLPVTLYQEAVISVFPCRGFCRTCCGNDAERGGKRVFRQGNLLLAEMDMEVPEWVDRVRKLEKFRAMG